ncbi:DNA helicase PSH3 [Plasmodium yoelii yoelii]|uniref:DNA helicase PSH3 n=1 Tax=Plasmodium yoelii yoelii TaxID=73239 RepID=A0AAF0B7B8_PLAYO|nr:DNA helicase PSH3 [Plasmodium yoelii yoelii]
MNLSDLNKLLVDSENNENEKEKEKEFQELNIPEEVINSLKQINIVYPSPIQYITIKEAIQKQDLIIQSKNGTGKSTSICIILISHIIKRIHKNVAKNKFKSFLNNNKDDNYCGSAINGNIEKDNYCEDAFSFSLYFYGIVLVPTRELCVQINDVINKISENLIIKKNKQLDTTNEFRENVIDKHVENSYILKIRSIILYGGTDVYDNIKNLFLTLPQIIISTPGRLKHILKMFQNTNIELDNINLFQKIDSKKIKISYLKIVNLLLKKLIIDEVDALLDEQFEDQMKIIFNSLINPNVQILAYSSTFRESTIDIFKKMVTSIDISYINKMINLYNQSTKLIKDHHYDSVTNDPVLASEENAKNGPKNGTKNWPKNWLKNCAGVEIDNSPSKQNLDDKVCGSSSCDKRKFKMCQTCTSVVLMQENEKNKISKLDSPILMNIKHCFITVNNENMNKHEELKYKLKVLLKIIKEIKFEQCFLFINNSYEGLQITKMMKKYNIDCYYVSSKVEHNERMQSFNKLKNNKMKIVICTDIMSRGIDNIVCDLVINFDIPCSKEIYIHRSGRCGRYGNKGLCISLCNYTDYNYLYYFKYTLKLNVYDFYYLSSSQKCSLTSVPNQTNTKSDPGIDETDPCKYETYPCKEKADLCKEKADPCKDETVCDTLPVNSEHSEWGALDFYSNSEILKNIIGKNDVNKIDKIGEKEYKEKNFVKIIIKGFYSKFINTLKIFNIRDENIYLKIYFKKLLTKLKIIKNDITYFFYLPNDNIHFFKSINIIEHKSNLILYFNFKKKIKIYYTTYLDRLKSMTNMKEKKYHYTNFCMLFFCNSNNYMVLKIYYAFLFLFKHYQYPLNDLLASMPLMCANIKRKIENKKSKQIGTGKHIETDKGKNNFERFNYSSDSFLLLYDEINKWDKKENQLFDHKNSYNSDKNSDHDGIICMNKQGKIIEKGNGYDDIKFFLQFIFSSNKKKKRKYLITDMEKNINDKEYSSDNIDYNILNKTENVTFNTILFDDALNFLNISTYEKKQLANFSSQCNKIQCINNEQKIIANLNRLINSQIFLNLNYNENPNLMKSIFLQNHIQLCKDF